MNYYLSTLLMNYWLLLCYYLNWNNMTDVIHWFEFIIREIIIGKKQRIHKIFQNILNKTTRNVWIQCW